MSADPRSFWSELKERKVIRVAAIYAVVGWGVVEVAATLMDLLALPDWTARFVLVLVVLGFPLALVFAWIFDVTPDGVRRAAPLAKTSGRTSRAPFVAGIVVGIASVSLLAFLLPGGGLPDTPPGSGELDAGLVAIAPFQYSGPPEQEHLAQGVVHLLAPRFTGTVGPRAVDPVAMIASAEAGLETPEEAARRLSAGSVITGSVVITGAQVTLSASFRSLLDDSEYSTQVSGSSDSTGATIRALATSLLGLTTGEDTQHLDLLQNVPEEAIQEYLLGQREFRRARFVDAVNHFRRATQLDSTFALAGIAMGDAANNVADVSPTPPYSLAWRHQDNLGEQDLIYLRARLGSNYPRSRTTREAIADYQAALQLAPDRASTWYFLGETTLHRPTSFAALSDIRRYFERAVELDPRHGLAVNHLYLTDLRRGDLAAIQEDIRMWLAIDTSSAARAVGAVTTAIASGDTVGLGDAFAEALDNTYAFGTGGIWASTPTMTRGDWVVQLDERFLEAFMSTQTPLENASSFRWAYSTQQDLGRPKQALQLIRDWEVAAGRNLNPRIYLMDVIYGELPDSLGASIAAQYEADLGQSSPEEWDNTRLLNRFAMALWTRYQGDSSDLDPAAGELRQRADNVEPSYAMGGEAMALLLEALSAEERGDATAQALLARSDSLFSEGPDGIAYNVAILELAGLYERLGNAEKALLTLEREAFFQPGDPFNMRFVRERGRLAALTGDTARATTEYEYYLRMRYAPEPEVEADVAEVRAALEALRN